MTMATGTYRLGWMDDAQYAFWFGYVARIAAMLNMADWHIIVDRGAPTDDDANAQAIVHSDARSIVIRFGPQWLAMTPEQQREIVAHELIHATVDLIDTHVWHAEKVIGGTAMGLLREVVRHDIEAITDTLARAVAPAFPLPTGQPS